MAGESTGGGVGFLGLLTILFIGLKLGGVIGWPWIWVLMPTIAPSAIFVAMAILFTLDSLRSP